MQYVGVHSYFHRFLLSLRYGSKGNESGCSGLRAYYLVKHEKKKKRRRGQIQHGNTVTLFQLLHIAAPISVERVQNQNCELPGLAGEKAEAPCGSNEVLTPTSLYYVIML